MDRRWLICLMLLICFSGCVRRRMTIRSNPPGALVYIDDQEIGRTPVSTPYVYYGTRKIRLMKDGYQTIVVQQPFRPPWYQLPGVDFFAENVYPYELRDERVLDFDLVPQSTVSMNEVLTQADQLRSLAAPRAPAAPASFEGAIPINSHQQMETGPTGPWNTLQPTSVP